MSLGLLLCLSLTASFKPLDAVFADGFVAVRSGNELYLLDSGSEVSLAAQRGKIKLVEPDWVSVLPASFFATPQTIAKIKISGVIGSDWIRQHQVRIDYESKTVGYRDSIEPVEVGYASVPIREFEAHFYIASRIGDVKTEFLLDSGANVLAIGSNILKSVRKTSLPDEDLGGFPATARVKTFRVPDVSAGGLVVTSERVFEDAQLPDKGTIGTSVLAPKSIILDFSHLRIWLPS